MEKPNDGDKKSKTSKSRRETAVQGTNDSSIVSKCSMAAQGYFDDPYLKAFVSKVTRRAPLIHRGYYIRAKTIDFILKSFLEKNKGTKQIISLGAGFDSAYFRLHSQDLLKDVVFFEVDFPEVVKRKCALIKANSDMMEMVGKPSTSSPEKSPLIEMTTSSYKLLGVDLAQTNTLEAALKLCDADFDTPTLLMSECVLTYMTRRCASGVVRWAAETFCNSVFVLYEQINPDDAFGLFMQHHFHTVGSPLKSINSFPSIQSQRERFSKLGWCDVDLMDMNQFYYTLLSPAEHDRVEGLELFDEYEEWHLKCAHYMVLCGYHGNCPQLLTSVEARIDIDGNRAPTHDQVVTLTHPTVVNPLKRFGHGTIRLGDQLILCAGGFGEQKGKHMRVTDVTFVNLSTLQTWVVDPGVDNKKLEVSRMHATATCLNDGTVILIGGRLSPMRLCTQIVSIKVNYGKGKYTEAVNMEMERKNSVPLVENVNCGNTSENMNCVENEKQNMNCDEMQVAYCGELISDKKAGEIMNCEFQNEFVKKFDENLSSNNSDLKSSEMNILEKSDVVNNLINNSKTGDKNIGIKNDTNENEPMNCELNDNINSDTKLKPNENVKHEEDVDIQMAGEGLGGVQTEGNPDLHLTCMEVNQTGDLPCPRWRHTAVLYNSSDTEESVIVYGGRTQSTLALGDCFMYTPATTTWRKLECNGITPVPRQSHSATLWGNNMVIAGGLQDDLQPLTSVHMLDIETLTWTEVPCTIKPRYSHTAHVLGDFLVLIGGVNFSHSPPGVAVIHLPSGNSAEFSLPAADKNKLIMLHGHTSISMDNNRILLLGGGGNCFSFGTHLNSSPIIMDITKAIQMMEQV